MAKCPNLMEVKGHGVAWCTKLAANAVCKVCPYWDGEKLVDKMTALKRMYNGGPATGGKLDADKLRLKRTNFILAHRLSPFNAFAEIRQAEDRSYRIGQTVTPIDEKIITEADWKKIELQTLKHSLLEAWTIPKWYRRWWDGFKNFLRKIAKKDLRNY